MTVTVAAFRLRPGWIVLPEGGQPRRVGLARCEGAPPHVLVCWCGGGRTVYGAAEPVTVQAVTGE